MSEKIVRYDYFQVYCKKYEKGQNTVVEKKFDLSPIFDKATTLKASQTVKPFRGEKARIQEIKRVTDTIWGIEFLRLREVNPPGIANEDGDFAIIKLEDGEYIGEFTGCLYDSQTDVIVIHRNIHAFTPSGIQEYLNSTLNVEDTQIFLKPIISGSDIKKIIKAKIYRSFEISIATDEKTIFDNGTSLGELLKKASNFKGSNINLSIGVGHAKKDKSLDTKSLRELISGTYTNKEMRKLTVKYKEDEDTKTEEVDLLEDRRHDFYKFDLKRNIPLTYLTVFNKMIEKYKERKEKNNIFNEGD